MKAFLTILPLTILLCCASDSGNEQFVYDVGFELSVSDLDGSDLLNPSNPHSFKDSEIKIFYLINGSMIEVYDENMDYPRNFFIYQHENKYRIKVFLNHSETEESPKTYIHWSETEVDSLSAEFNRSNSFVKLDRAWLNEELIWISSGNAESYYEIVK